MMKVDFKKLEQSIPSLLENPEYQDHPLHPALSALWQLNQEQWQRVERITQLSDSYQGMMLEREKSLGARFDKQIRQLEKVTRISDRYQKMLKEMNATLEQAALQDDLTNLPNRRMIMRYLNSLMESRQLTLINAGYDSITSYPIKDELHSLPYLAVVMVDIDFFKQVNDNYGHQVGDEVLIRFSKQMKDYLVNKGFCGRWGGEEFLIILSEQNLETASQLLEAFKQQVASHLYEISASIKFSLTISIGLTFCRYDDESNSLINRSDKALYCAKAQGRDCLVHLT